MLSQPTTPRRADSVRLVRTWTDAPQRRRSARVVCGATARLSLGWTTWRATVENLSDTGAALSMDAGALLLTGMAVLCELPEGTVVAEVRSVRAADANGRIVVGVEWSDADDAAMQWVARRVAERVCAA